MSPIVIVIALVALAGALYFVSHAISKAGVVGAVKDEMKAEASAAADKAKVQVTDLHNK